MAANYGLKTVVDQHSLDIAARILPLEVDSKIVNALLAYVTATTLAAELASRDATNTAKADASALVAYDTALAVDGKIANALLPYATVAQLASELAVRDATLAGLQASKADTSLLATNAALSASETVLQASLDAILADLATLQSSSGGVSNAPPWAGQTNVIRNLEHRFR